MALAVAKSVPNPIGMVLAVAKSVPKQTQPALGMSRAQYSKHCSVLNTVHLSYMSLSSHLLQRRSD